MIEIGEIVEIIAECGGKAAFDMIIKSYQKKHRMVVFSEHRSLFLRVLNNHPSLVFFDTERQMWVLAITELPPSPQPFPNRQDTIADYISNQLPINLEWERSGELLRLEFVNDYPIDSIESLELDDYLIAKSGYGNDHSFCHRLKVDLKVLSSMGNAWPSTFELYYKNGLELDMSISYKKMFDGNVQKAFSFLKKEIVRLLTAAKNNDFSTVESCKINSLFKAKLISVYFPEQYVPVCVKDALYEYCSRAGVLYSKDQDMVYGMSALSNWKNSHEETHDWSNAIVMSFCDWMWRNNLTIDSRKLPTDKPQVVSETSAVENTSSMQSTQTIRNEKPTESKGRAVANVGEISVGTEVYSKKLGKGIIELIEDAKDEKKYLSIDFNGEKKKFLYPDAFRVGFLLL